ncbi:hypothetical protein OSTOST_12155, partial [Ostertagia ostertagi]
MLYIGFRCQSCSEKGHTVDGNFPFNKVLHIDIFIRGIQMFEPNAHAAQVYKCDLEKIAHRLLNYDGSHYQLHVYAVNHYEGPIANISTWPYEMVNATNFWLGDFPSMQRVRFHPSSVGRQVHAALR